MDPVCEMGLASLAKLERCHRRHDDVMAGLLEAARRLAAGRPEPTDLSKVHEAVAFFERSVTRHFLDEEGSVFPRLSTRRPELAEALATLSAEHPSQIMMQVQIAEAVKGLDDSGRPGAGKTLLDAAEALAAAHRSHVSREDDLFATAESALTEQDDLEISAEMETRRDRDEGDGGGGGHGRRRREMETTEKKTAPMRKVAPAKKATPAKKKPAPVKKKAAPAKKKPVAKKPVAKKAAPKKAAPKKAAPKKAAPKKAAPKKKPR